MTDDSTLKGRPRTPDEVMIFQATLLPSVTLEVQLSSSLNVMSFIGRKLAASE